MGLAAALDLLAAGRAPPHQDAAAGKVASREGSQLDKREQSAYDHSCHPQPSSTSMISDIDMLPQPK